MWIELGKERPGPVLQNNPRIWVNTDHIVRAEFTQEGPKLTATVISTKPGGSDRTIFTGDDAERLRLTLNMKRNWTPYLDYELKEFEEKRAADEAAKAAAEALTKPAKKGKTK